MNIISTNQTSELHSEFFKKSHELVFSQLSLSPVEHDMLALFLTRLAKEHWSDYEKDQAIDKVPRYEFTSDVLAEWFGIKKTQLFAILDKPADRLSNRKIGLRSPENKSFDYIPLFKRIRYKDGVLTVVPNDELIREYLSIGLGHSQIPHRQFRQIPIEYGKRLFSMLCRFREFGELHSYTIEYLHGFFGLLDQKGNLSKSSLTKASSFINRVIKPAIKSVAENAPEIQFLVDDESGNFGFKCVKQGRKTTGIEFLYQWTDVKPKNLNNKTEVRAKNSELTLDDAVKTHYEIEKMSSTPSKAEIDNLKKFMPQLLLDGFLFDDKFVVNLRACEQLASD